MSDIGGEIKHTTGGDADDLRAGLTNDLIGMLAREGAHVLGLYALLRCLHCNNQPGDTFNVGDELRVAIGWKPKRFAAARERLLDLGLLTLVRPAGRSDPAVYRWTHDAAVKATTRPRGVPR